MSGGYGNYGAGGGGYGAASNGGYGQQQQSYGGASYGGSAGGYGQAAQSYNGAGYGGGNTYGTAYGSGGGGFGGGGGQYGSGGGFGGGGGGGYAGYGGGGNDITIQVPSQFVGRIIGRGGSKIKELQETSGCRIKVDKDSNNSVTASISLSGTPESAAVAKQLIEELCVNDNFGGGGGGGGGGYGGGGRGGGMQMSVPKSVVGKIIGKGGCKIRELQDDSGARIKIDKSSNDYSSTASVEIIGDPSAQMRAKQMIEELLQEAN